MDISQRIKKKKTIKCGREYIEELYDSNKDHRHELNLEKTLGCDENNRETKVDYINNYSFS